MTERSIRNRWNEKILCSYIQLCQLDVKKGITQQTDNAFAYESLASYKRGFFYDRRFGKLFDKKLERSLTMILYHPNFPGIV